MTEYEYIVTSPFLPKYIHNGGHEKNVNYLGAFSLFKKADLNWFQNLRKQLVTLKCLWCLVPFVLLMALYTFPLTSQVFCMLSNELRVQQRQVTSHHNLSYQRF